jgi:hypothetical protein
MKCNLHLLALTSWLASVLIIFGSVHNLFFMFIILLVAMKPHEIQEKLGLTRIRDRNWYVQPSCATTGDGLYEGLTWLTSNHKLWTHQQWLATFHTHSVTRHTIVVIQCILVASLWSEVAVWLCPPWLQVIEGLEMCCHLCKWHQLFCYFCCKIFFKVRTDL